MPETYEQYVKNTKKKGTSLVLTKYAWERSRQLAPTMQRHGVKPGPIVRGIEKKQTAIQQILRGLRGG